MVLALFTATVAIDTRLLWAAEAQGEAVLGLRMIVVRTEAEADSILKALQTGEKFEELAKSRSTDSSAHDGGYLGVFSLQDLRSEFQTALQGLKPGETSRIARIGKEFAVLKLLTSQETQDIEFAKWRDAGADPGSPVLGHLWTLVIASNDLTLTQKLVTSGANVNAPFSDGSTALMGAAQVGEAEIVRSLIAAGANVNAQTRDGATALLLAAQNGHAGVVTDLLKAGANVDARKNNGGTALIDAAFGGRTDVVQILLDSKADPNITLQDGSNALMAAAGKGYTDIIQGLLRAGAKVNAGADTGGTALMEAAYAGKLDAVRTLLAAGADSKLANPDGITALMGAALGGHTAVVQALLTAGSPLPPRDKRGWTALTYARASANSATVRAILDKTTDITAQDRSIALGGTYVNEYYSSNDPNLLNLAAAEFEKVLNGQPQNAAALEWMGATEFSRWGQPPTQDQFRKANTLLVKATALDPKDPDRHCWIAAIDAIYASPGMDSILDEGIEHAKKAIELDPQFVEAMDYLSILYRKKGNDALATAATRDAEGIRNGRGNRPSRFNDQFSRPALPSAPK
jgi:ankyrin repeat protein